MSTSFFPLARLDMSRQVKLHSEPQIGVFTGRIFLGKPETNLLVLAIQTYRGTDVTRWCR